MPSSGVVSIAKGSFDEEALGSPQLTMDSIGSDSDCEAVHRNGAPAHDEDENDVMSCNPRELRGPLSMSSDSAAPSVHSTDQILEMKNCLDLSDSQAILTRLNNSKNATPLESTTSVLSNRKPNPSKFPNKSIPQISRRPSVHETYDSVVLRQAEFLYYLYSFAILGTTLRLFLGRLFGSDCESPGEIEDFLSPLSEKICVTSGGTTLQHGGALFLDFPANMLGSFIMGMVSSLYPEGGRKGSRLPWLRKTHPLQNHQGIHHAIKVGFCGSLTTFSSWNSQMVTMMDGTYTELGPQVVPAIFGYIIGMASSLYAFSMGGKVHEWLYDWSNRRDQGNDANHEHDDLSLQSIDHDAEQPTSWDSEDSAPQPHNSKPGKGNSTPEEEDSNTNTNLTSMKDKTTVTAESMSTCFHKVIPFCISVSVVVAYGMGVDEGNMQFFRELFACSLFTPVGVHLRWKLSALNGRGIPCGSSRKYEWMPWGTFTCNILAAAISILFQALMMQYTRNGKGDNPYVLALLVGMKSGVAGSLSTVSSFAKETVNLATSYPTHAKSYIYSTSTIAVSMLLGLAIYSPMVRNS